MKTSGPKQTGINRNIGVAVRPFRWLSLSDNKSTTFDLNIGRFDPFGNELPRAGGDGRDYGIRVDRNLLNANDPVPVGALTTGAVYRIATVDSRVTALTFGVDF